jgi:uncharacterized protein (TIGR00296 family)
MVSASKEMVVYCFDTLVAYYTGELVPPPAFEDGQHPLFVTWKKVVGGERSLRGCIGALEARSLFNGLKDYALRTAFCDGRFPPIEATEIPYLECTVSILTDFEAAANYLDWEVGKHGIIMKFTDTDGTSRSATYLPAVAAEQGWTKMETIDSLIRKSGFVGSVTESLRKTVRIVRYQSSVYTMHYSDYVTFVQRTRGTVPLIGVGPY